MSEKNLQALVANDKIASEQLIILSWEDADWFEVLQSIGIKVFKLERLAKAADEFRSKPMNTNTEWVKPLDKALKDCEGLY